MTAKRFLFAFLICAVAATAAFVISMFAGPAGLSFREVLAALTGSPVEKFHSELVDWRLARGAAGAIAGGMLGLAGCLSQAALRNPLADPYILGISGSAGLGALIAGMVSGTSAASSMGAFPLPAAVCAFIAVFAILALETRLPKLGLEGVILLGVMVNAFCGAGIIALASMLNEHELAVFYRWTMGTLGARVYDSHELAPLGMLAILLCCAGLMIARKLNLLLLSDDEATAMGGEPRIHRRAALVLCAAATAVSVSLAGLVGFVGLVAPHIVRRLWGSDLRILVPASALLGAALVMLCDSAGRTLLSPSEMPVGVVTAVVGAPIFVLILIARARSSR